MAPHATPIVARNTPGAPGAGRTYGYRPGDVTGLPVGAYGS